MTIAEKRSEHLHRTKYKCDICGKIDFWSDGWSSYGSLAHEETCAEDMPHACSDSCFKKLRANLKSRKFVIPVLRQMDHYFYVAKPRVGY